MFPTNIVLLCRLAYTFTDFSIVREKAVTLRTNMKTLVNVAAVFDRTELLKLFYSDAVTSRADFHTEILHNVC